MNGPDLTYVDVRVPVPVHLYGASRGLLGLLYIFEDGNHLITLKELRRTTGKGERRVSQPSLPCEPRFCWAGWASYQSPFWGSRRHATKLAANTNNFVLFWSLFLATSAMRHP